jgi:ribosomal protein S18 acetylase RimI-like enzyme
MICIVPLEDSSPLTLVQSARAMFKAYGEFVRNTGNHPGFRFDRLDQEILELPDAYSTRNGEVLLAMRGSEVLGCIAYRAVPTPQNPRTCEIKRLCVFPEQRAHGIGNSLVSTCIDRARARGYRVACLDTEPETMAAGHRTYLRLGFVEYERRYSATEGPVAFLKRPLCELAESG